MKEKKKMKKFLLAVATIALACGIGVAAVGCGGGDDGDITVVSRVVGSGTRDAFMELIRRVKKEGRLYGMGCFD